MKVWHDLALVSLLLVGCSASHGLGGISPDGEPQCPSGWLDTGTTGSTVRFFPNLDGRPGPARELEVSAGGDRNFWAITSIDIDSDGRKDIVLRDSYAGAALVEEPLSLWVFSPDTGLRTLPVANPMQGPSGHGFSAVGDFNGDGVADIQADGVVYFSGPTMFRSEWTCDMGIAVGDVDGDGWGDSVCFNNEVELWFGSRNESKPLDISLTSRMGRAGDVDGDGVAELVYWDDVSLESYIFNLVDVTRTSILGTGESIGDVDGDGQADLSLAPTYSEYFVYRGATREIDDEPYETTGESWIEAAPAGDANCDGLGDVFVTDGLPGVTRLRLGAEDGLGEEVWTFNEGRTRLHPTY